VERTRESGRHHKLLGRGSLHASKIQGGVGMSTYPETCNLAIERRTLPGESTEKAMKEITDACARVRSRHPQFDARVTLTTAQLPSDVSVDSPVVKRLRGALEREELPVKIEGLSAWTDAALLNAAGIVSVAVVIDHTLAPCQTERRVLAARQDGRIFHRYMALVVVAVECPGLQLPARQLAFMHQGVKRMLMVIAFFADGVKSGDEFTFRQHLFFYHGANGGVHNSSSIPS